MHNPCFECYIRRGHTYDPEHQESCKSCEYANAVKDRDGRIEELEAILKGVMRQVDKWLIADDFDKSEVERAEIMSKRIQESFNRHTALSVLKDISSCMYPDYNLFGVKTLVIPRSDFERIRHKYLDCIKED